MKKNYISAILVPFCALITLSFTSYAQNSFHRGSLLVSLSEGQTHSIYKTTDISDPHHPTNIHRSEMEGVRDPIIIEYGITNKWGIGLTSGADIFQVNPSQYYGFKKADNSNVKVTTSEFTFDSNFHFYTNKRLDLSVFGSIGMFGVGFKGKENSDAKPYSYQANGNMVRGGMRVRYYFFKRFGAFGMLSSYSGTCSPKGVKGNTVGTTTQTHISGFTSEVGLCYRFF